MKLYLVAPVFLNSQLWISTSGDTRIVGGKEAQIGQFPYAVSLQEPQGWWGRDSHYCGGSLIGRDVVLSAAHCGPALTSHKAVVGRHNLNTNQGQSISVASSFLHPFYNDKTTNNDIMLVFLEEPADEDIQFVTLNADISSPAIDASVTVAGWGTTSQGGSLSNVLLAVEKDAMSNEKCSGSTNGYDSYKGQISSGMLCASDYGEDSCQGDSGGPLVIQPTDGSSHVQVGVVSWGIGCADPDFPGVYARVSKYYDWIREEVCLKSSYPPAYFQCDSIEIPESTGFGASGSQPTVPTQTPEECTDTINWKDDWGDGCSWYEMNDEPGCPTSGGYGGGQGLAKDNCCYCDGKTPSAPITGPAETDGWGVSNFMCSYFSILC